MHNAITLVALILSLGLDTLSVSIALGVGGVRNKQRVALTFATFEAVMPLIGLLVGHWLTPTLGRWTTVIGGILLVAVGLYALIFDDDDDAFDKPLLGVALLTTALSVSLDELAVGFSIALVHVPLALTIVLIAMQALVLSLVGMTFGHKLKLWFGEWTEKAGGIALILLGLWIVIAAVFRLPGSG